MTQTGASAALRLSLFGDKAFTSSSDMCGGVATAKELICRVLEQSGAMTIHLFLACPSPFAMFLGHRLNATARVQCYEWTGSGNYTPTCAFNT